MNTKRIPRPFRARIKRAMRKYLRADEATRRGAAAADAARSQLKKLWRAIEDRTVPMSRTHHRAMSRTHHARPAPPTASKRKRALFSFKRIDGVTSMDDATTWKPAQAARR